MKQTSTARRFRTNPVEIVIFLIVTAVFLRSVYQLFYESPNFKPTALAPMMANPLSEGRAPASASQSSLNLDIPCEKNLDQETTANKVRLSGPICGLNQNEENAKFNKLSIANLNNKFSATVFTDLASGRFSTDYIPLSEGKNKLHLEFMHRSGKIIEKEILITKN